MCKSCICYSNVYGVIFYGSADKNLKITRNPSFSLNIIMCSMVERWYTKIGDLFLYLTNSLFLLPFYV